MRSNFLLSLCLVFFLSGCKFRAGQIPQQMFERTREAIYSLDINCESVYKECFNTKDCEDHRLVAEINNLNEKGKQIKAKLDSLNQLHWREEVDAATFDEYTEVLREAYDQNEWCRKLVDECPCSYLLE